MWRPRQLESARLKYLGIVDALEADIRSGQVGRGERLPPQRAIAEALGVDLTTVTRAFNEARRRGLVEAQAGRGTFIAEDPGLEGAGLTGPLIDLSMNIPPQPGEVDFRKLIPAGIAAVLAGERGLLHLHYQDSAGSVADRQAGALWLGARLPDAEAERVVLAPGAQAALFAICELLFRRGEVIAAGEMTYPGLKAVAAELGLVLEPLAMDGQGLLPEAFADACRRRVVRGLYLTPVMDNPTTASLPPDRREALAAIARAHGVAVIEDDPYSALCPEAVPAMAALVPELCWHIATLSKCATPALRIAYVLVPDPRSAHDLAGVLRASVLMASPLMAALASRWITDGTLAQMAAAVAAENRKRQQLAAAVFRGMTFAADPNGHHLWLELPAPWRAAEFADHADRAGVSIVPSSAFSITSRAEDAVRLSLGVAPDRGALEDALTVLEALLKRPALSRRAVV